MYVVKVVFGAVGLLVLGVIGLVVLGQVMRSVTGYVTLSIILGLLSALATFRFWNRRDGYSKEMDAEMGGSTWGRVRTRKEPGKALDDMSR